MKALLTDLGLLILRTAGGGLMAMLHGYGKMTHYSENKDDFYDFMGLGPAVSLALTVFGEFFCGVLVWVGLGTRLFAIPMIITMAVAFFGAHAGDPIGDREASLGYLLLYLATFLAGPGRLSVDQVLAISFPKLKWLV